MIQHIPLPVSAIYRGAPHPQTHNKALRIDWGRLCYVSCEHHGMSRGEPAEPYRRRSSSEP